LFFALIVDNLASYPQFHFINLSDVCCCGIFYTFAPLMTMGL